MEANYEKNGILDLLIRPGFCVKENKFTTTGKNKRKS